MKSVLVVFVFVLVQVLALTVQTKEQMRPIAGSLATRAEKFDVNSWNTCIDDGGCTNCPCTTCQTICNDANSWAAKTQYSCDVIINPITNEPAALHMQCVTHVTPALIAAIVVPLLICCCGCIGACVFCFWRRRKHHHPHTYAPLHQ